MKEQRYVVSLEPDLVYGGGWAIWDSQDTEYISFITQDESEAKQTCQELNEMENKYLEELEAKHDGDGST